MEPISPRHLLNQGARPASAAWRGRAGPVQAPVGAISMSLCTGTDGGNRAENGPGHVMLGTERGDPGAAGVGLPLPGRDVPPCAHVHRHVQVLRTLVGMGAGTSKRSHGCTCTNAPTHTHLSPLQLHSHTHSKASQVGMSAHTHSCAHLFPLQLGTRVQ